MRKYLTVCMVSIFVILFGIVKIGVVYPPTFWGEAAIGYPDPVSYVLLDLYSSPIDLKKNSWSGGFPITDEDRNYSQKFNRLFPRLNADPEAITANDLTNWSSGRYSPYFDGKRWIFFKNNGEGGIVVEYLNYEELIDKLKAGDIDFALMIPPFEDLKGLLSIQIPIRCYALGKINFLKYIDFERILKAKFGGYGKVFIYGTFSKVKGPNVVYQRGDLVSKMIAEIVSKLFGSKMISKRVYEFTSDEIGFWCGFERPDVELQHARIMDIEFRIYFKNEKNKKFIGELFPSVVTYGGDRN